MTDTLNPTSAADSRPRSIEKMLLPELKQLASSMGIKGASGLRKPALVERRRGARGVLTPRMSTESTPSKLERLRELLPYFGDTRWPFVLAALGAAVGGASETAFAAMMKPLFDEGFRSIGCQPCTRRVEAGEDARAGRWAGLDKTECGIHLDFQI